MTDNQPNHEFMDGQWSDLPVPDGEQAWQKMNTLLDEDDKKRRLLPPIVLRSCTLWGTLLLTVAAGLWFLFTGGADHTTSEVKPQQTKHVLQRTSNNRSTTPSVQPSNTSIPTAQNTPEANDVTRQNTPTNKKNVKGEKVQKIIKNNTFTSTAKVKEPRGSIKDVTLQNQSTSQLPPASDTRESKQPKAVETNISNPSVAKDPATNTQVPITNTGQNTTAPVAPKDTTKKAVAQPEPVAATPSVKQLKEKLFYFTAGIGEQQQIPVAGQAAYPYNYYGRKGSISDYIPSLYMRLHRQDKWFAQAEFRYGAPQSVKDFSFSRQTKWDATGSNITTTSLILKKTYYHQVPLSFNYYIAPHLSIGLGGVYSRFYGAITEEEVKSTNVQTQAESVTRKLVQVPHFNDSFLYKTQVHLLFQTDYQWKRFSFGLRYKKDIQPYIKYTTPAGDINTEKNQALEFIMRFRVL